MKSIEITYTKIKDRNPHIGDYICLAQAVKSRNFSRKVLIENFKKLISKAEYEQIELKGLINHLEYLTNTPEGGEITPINRLGATQNTVKVN